VATVVAVMVAVAVAAAISVQETGMQSPNLLVNSVSCERVAHGDGLW
jgi:hypothetical protein